MKKIIVMLLAVVMSCGLVFAGCNKNDTRYNNKLDKFDGEISSNGGFAVVKGDYVYFINGVASNTEDNTYGKPVTGALVRIKKDSLKDAANRDHAIVSAEMVIPSLFVAGDLTSGFYMFETDGKTNVFFASPYTEKNKEGEVQNDRLSFVRASIDGSEKAVILTVDSNTTEYTYVQNDNGVYLLVKTNVKDERSESDSATRSAIVVYDALKGGDPIFTSEKVSEYAFGKNDVYYTVTAYDEQLKQEEKYNDLYRYVAGEKKSELVLSGQGMIDSKDGGTGLTGVTYSIIKNTEKYLFLKKTYVDSSVTTVVTYDVYDKETKALDTLDNGSSVASKVFASNSYYANANCIVYLDTTYGLVMFNKNLPNNSELGNGDVVKDHCVRLFYDKDLVGYTVRFWNDGYLYLTDSDNYYYRVNVAALVDFEKGEKKDAAGKVEKVNFLANSTSWYLPEVIGDYFLSVYTATPYYNLVYVSDMIENQKLADDEKSEEKISEIRASEKDSVEKNHSTCISLISESISNTYKDYIKNTFDTEEDK